ncbi:MAG: sigma-70 family RNA polymerase sigma factor [Planctomycetota bacterium]|jgi:RNA polymerase sigma factor (TIGR02999 family)
MSNQPDSPKDGGTVTQLLKQLKAGRRDAFDELWPCIYDELRRIAHRQRWGERDDHTLTTTALVHEAYLKLVDQRQMDWENRAHFLGVAARAMRRILVSYARGRHAAKRGGVRTRVALDEAFGLVEDSRVEEILGLDEALQRLEQINPRHANIVQCRFFGGLTIEETAEALGVAPITVTRDWRMARAWLRHELDQS